MGIKKKVKPVKKCTTGKEKNNLSHASANASVLQRRKAMVRDDDEDDEENDENEEEISVVKAPRVNVKLGAEIKGKGKDKKGLKHNAASKAGKDGQKLTRLATIKVRHESMRREIDQIREDLESEEDE